MGVWMVPLMIAILAILAISLYATMQVMSLEERRNEANDTPVSEGVKEHPIALNPIIWVYIVALGFVTFVIGVNMTSY